MEQFIIPAIIFVTVFSIAAVLVLLPLGIAWQLYLLAKRRKVVFAVSFPVLLVLVVWGFVQWGFGGDWHRVIDYGMYFLLMCAAYGFQFLMILLIAAALACLVTMALGHRKHSFVIPMVLLVVLECGGAFYLAEHPILSVPEEFQSYVSAEEETRILSVSSGFYSATIPVFPVHVQITSADEDQISFRTQYFFFGSTEHTLGPDGFNCTKPLAGI